MPPAPKSNGSNGCCSCCRSCWPSCACCCKKSTGKSNKPSTSGSANNKRGFRGTLINEFHSRRFNVVVMGLILLDCLLVFCELMLDIHFSVVKFKEHSHYEHTLHEIEHILHYLSLGILVIFTIEVILKVYAYGTDFFCLFEDLIDAIIIIVSLVLDIVFMNDKLLKYTGVLIFFRLWRIIRIVFAVFVSYYVRAEAGGEEHNHK